MRTDVCLLVVGDKFIKLCLQSNRIPKLIGKFALNFMLREEPVQISRAFFATPGVEIDERLINPVRQFLGCKILGWIHLISAICSFH